MGRKCDAFGNLEDTRERTVWRVTPNRTWHAFIWLFGVAPTDHSVCGKVQASQTMPRRGVMGHRCADCSR